ncbi:hypothetical protein FRUB_05337 [Fimbriiglobus ruber]|uniref:Uncharacterized protein n=1 Tax=Fimbriiglobus ruber TaxID=1908690 RepID=A0A225DPA3_9BACT|nr:hypothetical protein FRUB_05337 [Fimbriiglobus ruber]
MSVDPRGRTPHCRAKHGVPAARIPNLFIVPEVWAEWNTRPARLWVTNGNQNGSGRFGRGNDRCEWCPLRSPAPGGHPPRW